MKKKCRRKIYQLVNPISHAIAGAGITTDDCLKQLKDKELAAIEAMRTGNATVYTWQELVDMNNICQVMSRHGIGPEALPDCMMAEIELIKHNAQKPFTVNVNAGSVPGSANWDRIRKAEESKTLKEQALQGATYDLDRLGQAANDLKNHPGLGRITGVMSLLPNVPGNDAANAAAKLDTLKSQIAFNVLQSLRSMSKTGGALGQVSDKEEAMLSNNLAALDAKQGTPEFKKALDNIIRYTQDVKARLSNAAKLDVGVNSSGNQLPQGATEMGVENGKPFQTILLSGWRLASGQEGYLSCIQDCS